ncbi:hypothetical protein PRUPE_4G106300 [Prunus persica]|uniref:Sey1/RHD3-like three-helix bundle domain-containing protein n=1 Tax=Prunus persica TaxID=3760 RepID=A0A251PIQ7_PRUPE|nr:hypothetical protein PRUPE_4G106300 [Prunus persica]
MAIVVLGFNEFMLLLKNTPYLMVLFVASSNDTQLRCCAMVFFLFDFISFGT